MDPDVGDRLEEKRAIKRVEQWFETVSEGGEARVPRAFSTRGLRRLGAPLDLLVCE